MAILKTTIIHEELKGVFKYGDTIEITLNDVRKKPFSVDNLFGATPGNSSYILAHPAQKDNPYLEISVWRPLPKNPTTGLAESNHPTRDKKLR